MQTKILQSDKVYLNHIPNNSSLYFIDQTEIVKEYYKVIREAPQDYLITHKIAEKAILYSREGLHDPNSDIIIIGVHHSYPDQYLAIYEDRLWTVLNKELISFMKHLCSK